jgi:hypothetical protein
LGEVEEECVFDAAGVFFLFLLPGFDMDCMPSRTRTQGMF